MWRSETFLRTALYSAAPNLVETHSLILETCKLFKISFIRYWEWHKLFAVYLLMKPDKKFQHIVKTSIMKTAKNDRRSIKKDSKWYKLSKRIINFKSYPKRSKYDRKQSKTGRRWSKTDNNEEKNIKNDGQNHSLSKTNKNNQRHLKRFKRRSER